MVKFNLISNHYIRKLDSLNWILSKTVISKRNKTREQIIGYYPDLPIAWRNAITTLSLTANSNQELQDIVSKLEKLYTSSPPMLK